MLGQELRAIREQRGLSARACAVRAGISPASLTAIERGDRYPTLETLEGLCACLGISVVVGPHETFINPDPEA